MLKIYNYITKTALIIAIFTIPAIVSAGTSGYFGSDSWNSGSGWSDWGGNAPVYSYEYTPNYTYTYPSYTTPSYNTGYYRGSSYTPNYYTPTTYTTPSYGIGYYGSSYGGSSVPNSSVNTSSSNSTATATSNNTNINNNNVYVYTNPTGNAVVYNPSHQNLNGYCNIVPTNPRLGQTVTATAYATGGIGNYTYSWGGDLNTNSYGVSTSFTSYNPGTKNITVTIRSDQEVVTRTCNVTFGNTYNTISSYYSGNYYGTQYGTQSSLAITRSISPSGSGIYLNDLPATGLSLNFVSYMVIFMIIILAVISTFVLQSRKRLLKARSV